MTPPSAALLGRAPRRRAGGRPGRRGRSTRATAGQGHRSGTVEEVSAGGLVVDRSGPRPCAALTGRRDQRGRLLWSLPRGHLEDGETAEAAAVREVEEETGIHGRVLAALGDVDYWFVVGGRRIHKTVHHYLLEADRGELSDSDVEVDEVDWVAMEELDVRLAHAGERRLTMAATDLLTDLS